MTNANFDAVLSLSEAVGLGGTRNMITVTIVIDAPTASGKTIPRGSVVEYLGHVPFGMVQVRYEGREEIIHPRTTKELR